MRAIVLHTALLVVLAAPVHGAAAPSPGGPGGAVRDTLARARAIVLTDDSHEQKVGALHELARQLMDSREMGRRAIGPRLAEQPAAQQEEFLTLFDDVIVRAYLEKLLFFRRPRFAFGEEETAEGAVVVHTRILTEKDEFFVDYEMHQRDGTWLASDIVVEGISLTRNYAQQFEAVLRSRSFPELLELMRTKVAGLRARAGS